MRVLIYKNKIKWDISKKISDTLAFFKGMKFSIEVQDTNFENIPVKEVVSSPNSLGNYIKFKQIEDNWYDTNISIPARNRGFDCVILLQEDDYKGSPAQGYRMYNNLTIQEIVVEARKKGSYNYCGASLKGDRMTWVLIHELLHALYLKEKKEDNTHKYFYARTPEKCLEDFKTMKYKYFNEKDDPKMIGVSPILMTKIDKMREYCGFPFVITSGYRTPEYNATLKDSVEDSAHCNGLAIDIACPDSSKRMKMIESAFEQGIKRVGIGSNYLHFDIDDTKPQKVIWLYN